MSLKTDNRPSSLACLPCRDKHLKCNGQMPCARCASTDTQCVFTKSRRGYKGPKRQRLLTSMQPQSQQLEATTPNDKGHLNLPTLLPSQTPEARQTPSEETISVVRTDIENSTTSAAGDDGGDYFIDLFYNFVHPAHPIVVPRRMYLQDRQVLPEHLKKVMKLMGSHFTSYESEELHQLAADSLNESTVIEDGFKVQSLLLFSLSSFARFDREQGVSALKEAITLADRIGMNRPIFGQNQSRVLQESWRRTWWEVYIILGTVQQLMPTDLILEPAWDLPLPIDCEDYNECKESASRTLSQMQDRYFMEDNFQWSSFAYKIEATRILKNIIELGNDPVGASKAQIESAKASITSLTLSLPPGKRDAISKTGDTDEVMFFALMLIHLASIFLHLPRSGMSAVRNFKTSCWDDSSIVITTDDHSSHRLSAVKAANKMSQLISDNEELTFRSPCFACTLSFSTAVHFSAYVEAKDSLEAQGFKERIQLSLSSLQRMGEVWPLARVIRGQIAQFAKEVLHSSRIEFPKQQLVSNSSIQSDDDSLFEDQQWLQELMGGSMSVMDSLDFSNSLDFDIVT